MRTSPVTVLPSFAPAGAGRSTSVPRRRSALLAAVVLGTTVLGLVPATPAASQTTGSADALQARVRAELTVFTDWLTANGAAGYVGEVGWPSNVDTAKWNDLARTWYADAAASGLWTSGYATGEWWGTTYKLSNYVWATAEGPLGLPRPSAAVIEEQVGSERRSVNMAGAEFGPIGMGLMPTSTLSNANPGVYGRDYHYDKQESFTYLASRGISTVRLAFRWERIQPTLGAPLDPVELQRLIDAVGRAHAAGLQVILDVHNYGAYWLSDGTKGVRQALGSAQLPLDRLSDLWSRLSSTFMNDPGVLGYGLMNEPVGMAGANGLTAPQLWEQGSQAAINAIRANGDTKLVLVPGYQWSGVKQWATQHPRAWITDWAGNFRYEAHHYFDRDNSGTYVRTYDEEVADAEARGYRASDTTVTTAPATTTTTLAATTTTTVPATTTTTIKVTTTTVAPTTTTTVPATADTSPPTAPTNLITVSERKRVRLSWSPSTDSGGSGLAGYEVYRSSSPTGAFTIIGTSATTGYIDYSAVRRTTYRYYVRSYDQDGNRSPDSSVVSGTVS